jgi:hypothetical protein
MPKPIRAIDLRPAPAKLLRAFESAIKKFIKRHPDEAVTAVALACIHHEGNVFLAIDTGEFKDNPFDCTFDQVVVVAFDDWYRAHFMESVRLTTLTGKVKEGDPGEFYPEFVKVIKQATSQLRKSPVIDSLNLTKGCQIGYQMTMTGDCKFTKLK